MNIYQKLNKKHLASGKLGLQIIGALFEWRTRSFLAFMLLVVPLSVGVSMILAPGNYRPCIYLVCLNLAVWLTIKACNKLSGIFSLEKKEAGITWCQISILGALGVWLIGFIMIFSIQTNEKATLALGIIGSVAGWIFQDKIKGAVTFIHMRMHHQLNIGDWIQVPKYGVDGVVKGLTLTTVEVFNWDTTSSSFPIYALQADHFINLQHMNDGKTYGRLMCKTFLIDTGSFREFSAKELKALAANASVSKYLPADELREGVFNGHLFRVYLHHWLMDHPHVSQKPMLMVRWTEQKGSGMGIQIYAYLMDSDTEAFAWEQSRLMEEVVEAMQWFDLRLSQAPSADDFRSLINRVK